MKRFARILPGLAALLTAAPAYADIIVGDPGRRRAQPAPQPVVHPTLFELLVILTLLLVALIVTALLVRFFTSGKRKRNEEEKE